MAPETIGRFAVKGELGRGAMGIVYLAEDPFLGRKVAIKTIQVHPGLAESEVEELRRRFENEARAAANLAHPNMVTIFDAGADGHTLYIAMEYVQGEPLDEILKSDRTLTYKEVADLALQLAAALDYAHQRGIVHRDIKPANILVNRNGQPKITDFGVARQAASTLTATGTIIGTPAYMSPEQITGQKVTGASDQFSLGIVMYEMLTGRKPFVGEGATTILYKIVHEDLDPPGSVQQALPPAIDGILLRALAKAPEHRFGSCLEFAEELRSVLGAAPAEPALRLTATASGSMSAPAAGPAAVAVAAGLPSATGTHGTGTYADRQVVGALGMLGTVKGLAVLTTAALLVIAVALVLTMGADDSRSLRGAGGGPAEAAPDVAADPGTVQDEDLFAAADGLGVPVDEPAADLPARMTFEVNSRPAGARVMLDGKPLAQGTPVRIEVSSADRHTLLLEHVGRKSVSWAFVPRNLSAEQIESGRLFFPMEEMGLAGNTSTTDDIELVETQVSADVSAPGLDQDQPEEPLDPNGPVRVRASMRNVQPVELERRADPRLPEWAADQGLPNYVILELVIDRRGRVRDAKVVRAVHPSLEEIAIRAVREWRFKPATRDGKPIDAYFNVAVQFRPPR